MKRTWKNDERSLQFVETSAPDWLWDYSRVNYFRFKIIERHVSTNDHLFNILQTFSRIMILSLFVFQRERLQSVKCQWRQTVWSFQRATLLACLFGANVTKEDRKVHFFDLLHVNSWFLTSFLLLGVWIPIINLRSFSVTSSRTT